MPVEARAIDELKRTLGPKGYIAEPERMEPFLVAWRGGWRGASPLIALPQSLSELVKTVEICRNHRIGMVPQGGNTGTVGGCIPSPNGDQLVVGLQRMNKIRDWDHAGSAVTAEAGVILETLQTQASDAGFLFPISMASQGSAQIGGVASTNAGGTAVLRYGNTRQLVLGLEVVLPSGEVFSSLKGLRKDNMGYNLSQFFIGAEGTLGLISAVTLRLFRKPMRRLTAVSGTADPAAALGLLRSFQNVCGDFLSAFEIISDAAMRLVLKNIPGSRQPGAQASWYLLVELDAASQHVPLEAFFEAVLSDALSQGDISDAVLAENESQSKQFWFVRENISEAIRKQAAALHFDIALPLAELVDFLKTMEGKIKTIAPSIHVAPFGHMGDGNLHYNMCFDQMPSDFTALKSRIQDVVYEDVARRGGSLSAEHGIGTARKFLLQKYKPPIHLDLMRAVKTAIDPCGLMNPGKIFD